MDTTKINQSIQADQPKIIYNITTQVLWSIHQEWLIWLKQDFVQRMLATHCFTNFQIVRLLEVDEEQGPTYACQFYSNSINEYIYFLDNHAQNVATYSSDIWGNTSISFTSIMEVLS